MTLALAFLTFAFLLVNIWQITRIFRDLSTGVITSVAEAATA